MKSINKNFCQGIVANVRGSQINEKRFIIYGGQRLFLMVDLDQKTEYGLKIQNFKNLNVTKTNLSENSSQLSIQTESNS